MKPLAITTLFLAMLAFPPTSAHADTTWIVEYAPTPSAPPTPMVHHAAKVPGGDSWDEPAPGATPPSSALLAETLHVSAWGLTRVRVEVMPMLPGSAHREQTWRTRTEYDRDADGFTPARETYTTDDFASLRERTGVASDVPEYFDLAQWPRGRERVYTESGRTITIRRQRSDTTLTIGGARMTMARFARITAGTYPLSPNHPKGGAWSREAAVYQPLRGDWTLRREVTSGEPLVLPTRVTQR